MKITFMGTGAASLNLERKNTSLLFTASGESVLVDCSGTPLREVARAGISPAQLSRICVTHSHADHLYGFPSLIHMLWMWDGLRPGKQLEIAGPGEALSTLQQLEDACAFSAKEHAVRLTYVELDGDGGEFATLSDWKVCYFPVTHGGFQAVGYQFRSSDNRKVIYTGDALADQRVDLVLQGSIDLLIHDCGGGLRRNANHAGAQDIFDMVATSGAEVARIALTHLPELTSSELSQIREMARDLSASELLIPSDGESLTL